MDIKELVSKKAELIALKKNDLQGALQFYNQGTKTQPKNEQIWVGKAQIELNMQQFAQAEQSAKKAISIYF